ncbi:glycosyltransferase family 2 protein [Tessaracoccus sp. MC1865]|uniref:glycosyltransferase family 2 protein n=1 Tax=Tessaracoccus sp. MC1865 TaxID=2760310 RepID=UPI0016032C7C|nr:glycosyltransferase family 2 protein [Tessaracoccus sp. MC1865]MBB1483665.1 glycosyltransferase family 2 protein [Tessaracoccus sp. MC1865]QTO36737.1 glycosyltransferase family 2 protein [Tessaracoccus sp. MC1865]
MGRIALYLFGYAATAALVWAFLTLQTHPQPPGAWLRWVVLLAMGPSLFRYSVQLVLAPLYELIMARRRRRQGARCVVRRPSVSVLVPARNEEVGIEATVRSVLASDYPDLELVVVDDGSTDGTGEVMRRLVREHEESRRPGRLVFRSLPNAGKSRAMNTALSLSSGDLIITVDADSVVEPDAVREIVRLYDDPRVMSVAGNVKIGNHKSPIGLIQQFEYLYAFFFKKADSLLNAVYIVGGAAASYRRSIIDELGGFDETIITEDIEMSTRIQDAGGKVQYTPRAVIWTEGASDVAGLAGQRLHWKYGRLITFWRYRWMFLSIAPRHNMWLSWLVMPVTVIADLLLLLEPLLLALIVAYTWVSHDFLPIIVYIALLAVVLVFQVLTDVRRRQSLNLLLVAPIAWLLIYFVDAIEFQALTRSLLRISRRQGLDWQRWERSGVFSGEPVPELPPQVAESTTAPRRSAEARRAAPPDPAAPPEPGRPARSR